MILSTSKAGRLALFSCAIFGLIFFICSCRAVDLTSRFSDPTPTKGSGLLYSFQFSIFRDCRYHLEIRKIHSGIYVSVLRFDLLFILDWKKKKKDQKLFPTLYILIQP